MIAALTRRGAGLGVGAVVLYAGGEYLGYPLLRALAAVAALTVVVSVAAAARPMRLAIGRQLDRDRVHRGRPVHVSLTVRNDGRWWTPAFDAVDAGPVAVPGLRPRQEKTIEYTFEPQRRGRLTVGPLRADQTDPLGLTDRRRRLPGGTRELWVYPRLYDVHPLPAVPSRRYLTGVAGAAATRGSTELRALRPYVPGDEPRNIHWKATAASGELTVRDLVDPPEQTITVVLDTDPAALTPERFEEACDFAASLLVAAVTAGHHVTLSTTGGLTVRPRGTRGGVAVVLDALCTLDQAPGAGRAPIAESGPVVHITGRPGADLPARGGPVFLADLSGGTAPAPAGVTVLAGTDAAALVARWNAVIR